MSKLIATGGDPKNGTPHPLSHLGFDQLTPILEKAFEQAAGVPCKCDIVSINHTKSETLIKLTVKSFPEPLSVALIPEQKHK